MLDLNAPIIPWQEMWWIKLYTHIRDLHKLVISEDFESSIHHKYNILYEKEGYIALMFNIINGKLYAMSANKNYTWKLFWYIHIGMHIDEAILIESSLIYDDLEELYASDKWVVIETEVGTNLITSIDIYVKERQLDVVWWSFDRGEW